jgi:hypothetical protein
MSRLRRALLALTLVVALGASFALAPGVPAPRAQAAPPVEAPAATDPAARVATLGALVAERAGGRARAEARVADLTRRLEQAQARAEAARAQTNALGQQAAAAAARYEAVRAQLEELLVAAYRGKGNPSPVLAMLDSTSPMKFAYRQGLIKRVGEEQQRTIAEARRTRVAATAAANAAREERNRLVALAASIEGSLPGARSAAIDAQAAESRATFWLARWQAVTGGTATTIMGPTLLSGPELAQWFTGTKRKARITVPIDELTQDFAEEGTAAGVRGDIAFAQSILETGSLYFPDGGQVLPTDNNFAGMGACDSCATGNRFADARIGVRALMQQLRVYADPNLKNSQLSPPAVNPKLDTHFLKGKVPTWNGLTHTWATADRYGDRIIAIYCQILGWLTDRARL